MADIKKALKFDLTKAEKANVIGNRGIFNMNARRYEEAVEDFTKVNFKLRKLLIYFDLNKFNLIFILINFFFRLGIEITTR